MTPYSRMDLQSCQSCGRTVSKFVSMVGIPFFIIGLILAIYAANSGRSNDLANHCLNTSTQPLSSGDDLPMNSSKKSHGTIIWPNQRVPFVIDELLIEGGADVLIKNAMKFIESKTCIKFSEKKPTDKNWVRFVRNDGICYSSSIGWTSSSTTGQEIQLGLDCSTNSTIQRVLGRLLGLGYEETRPDREKYVHYNPLKAECVDRIENGGDEELMAIVLKSEHTEAALNILFDYLSHMFLIKECFQPLRFQSIHLGSTSDDGRQVNGKLSVLDIEKLNAIYNCSGCNSYRFQHIKKVETSHAEFKSLKPIVAGLDIDGVTPLYICRRYHQGSLLIGKLKVTHDSVNCWVGDKGKEYIYGRDFEVMTNPEGYGFTWTRSTNTSLIPKNIIVGARTNNRELIYIGKCMLRTSGHVSTMAGSYLPKFGSLRVPFGGIEHDCASFELLTC